MAVRSYSAATVRAGLRRGALGIVEGNDPGACRAPVLHARDHLLAHIAALGEIDAVELVHVGLMRIGVTIGEIEPAARDAEGNAVVLVG